MAQNADINLNINVGDGSKTIGDLANNFDKVSKNVGGSMKSLLGFKQEMKEIQVAMDAAAKAGNVQLFNKLKDKFIETKDAAKDFREAAVPLEDRIAGMTGYAGKAIGAFQNLATVFGADNKNAEELFKTFAKAQSITNLAGQIPTLIADFEKFGKATIQVGQAMLTALGPWGLAAVAIAAIGAAIYALIPSYDAFGDAMSSFNDAQAEAAKNSAKEITDLDIIKTRLEDVNITQETRTKLIEDLDKKYPGYLTKAEKEAAIAGTAAINFDKLATSIRKKAIAEAMSAKITENYSIILEKQLKIQELINKQDDYFGTNKSLIVNTIKILNDEIANLNVQNNAMTKVVAEQTNALEANADALDATTKAEQDKIKKQEEDAKKAAEWKKAHDEKIEAEKRELANMKEMIGLYDLIRLREEQQAERNKQLAKDAPYIVKAIFGKNPEETKKDVEKNVDIIFGNYQKKSEEMVKSAPVQTKDGMASALIFGTIDPKERVILTSQLIGQMGNSFSAFGQLVGAQTRAGAIASRVGALASIAANAAISLMENFKDAAVLGITPIEKAIIYATSVAQTIAAVAQAKQLLSSPLPFATGGLVPGAGSSDTRNAVLTPGEFVMKKSVVQQLGVDNLNRLNNNEPMVQRVIVVESDITKAQKNINKVQVRGSLKKIK